MPPPCRRPRPRPTPCRQPTPTGARASQLRSPCNRHLRTFEVAGTPSGVSAKWFSGPSGPADEVIYFGRATDDVRPLSNEQNQAGPNPGGADLGALWSDVYTELRQMARARLRVSGPLTLLDTAGLVSDTYMRLSRRGGRRGGGRGRGRAGGS